MLTLVGVSFDGMVALSDGVMIGVLGEGVDEFGTALSDD
jgi:hypothetical protein|tara:strand:+ start:1959 stop:2075 length:117 start_codon:yes stop_codon:yes gene_type:complete